jgi:hypothetical protein
VTGYIKDHRKELDSDVWLMPPLYHRTWQWLKYNVNHSDNEIPMRDGSKMLIKRGQRLTSIRDIAKGISWYEGRKPKEPNPKTISTILEWMEITNMIKIERGQGNRQYTLITLINYELYNEKEVQGNSKVTVREHLADINNNDKNDKQKDIYVFWNDQAITVHREMTKKMSSAINARLEKYSCDEIKQTIENYNTIIKSDLYYYTHRFTLDRFMAPNIFVQFLTENNPFQNFIKSPSKKVDKPSGKQSETVTLSDEERDYLERASKQQAEINKRNAVVRGALGHLPSTS